MDRMNELWFPCQEKQRICSFTQKTTSAVGSTQPPFQRLCKAVSPEVKRPGREAGLSVRLVLRPGMGAGAIRLCYSLHGVHFYLD